MKTIPQFELPVASEVFNLMVESAVDGERVRHEEEQAREDTFIAKQLETKQQQTLL